MVRLVNKHAYALVITGIYMQHSATSHNGIMPLGFSIISASFQESVFCLIFVVAVYLLSREQSFSVSDDSLSLFMKKL